MELRIKTLRIKYLETLMDDNKIKQCSKCKTWFTLEDLLTNQEIIPIGISLDDEDPAFNLFYFNHDQPDCMTTLTVNVELFRSKINELIPKENKAGKEGCEHHCTDLDDMKDCSNNCKWAPYRRFIFELMEKKNKVST